MNIKELSPGVIVVHLGDRDVLWAIDGQHRRFALEQVFDFLKEVKKNHDYPKRLKLYPVIKGQTMPSDELEVWTNVYEAARTTSKIMVKLNRVGCFSGTAIFSRIKQLRKKDREQPSFCI